MPLNAGTSGTLRLKVMLRLPEAKPSTDKAKAARLPLQLPLPGFAGYHKCAVCRAPAAAAASVYAAPADTAAHDRRKREQERELSSLRDQVRCDAAEGQSGGSVVLLVSMLHQGRRTPPIVSFSE